MLLKRNFLYVNTNNKNIIITGIISANQTSLETGEIASTIKKSTYTPASTWGKYLSNKTAPFF